MCIQKALGFSLVEAMIVIAIMGILASIAMPSYKSMIERYQLQKAVESLKSDLQLARTEAIKQSQDVIVSRKTGVAGAWCYGLARKKTSSRTSCDCTETNIADADYCDIKIVSGIDYSTTNMEESFRDNSTFSFRRGTIGNDGVTFTSIKYAIRVLFSDVGRVRICTPNPLPTGKIALPGTQSVC
jgi:type IV fimbrial biogenesis protein FimT